MIRRLALLGFVLLGLVACGRAVPQANQRGNEAFETGDYGVAVQAYEEAGEQAPKIAEPDYNSANAKYRAETYEDAEKGYTDALLKADEDLARQSVFNLGNAYFQTEKYEEAVEAYKEALRLAPDDLDAKHNLELALRQLEQPELQQDEQPQSEQQEGEQPEDPDEQSDQQQQGDQQQDDQQQSDQQQAAQQDQQEQQSQPQAGDPEQQAPQAPTALTEDQARQLLESFAGDTETLRGRLQGRYVVRRPAPEQDW